LSKELLVIFRPEFLVLVLEPSSSLIVCVRKLRLSPQHSHQHAPEKRISKGSARVVDQHKQIDSHSTSGVAKQKGTSHKAKRANTIAANAMRASFQLRNLFFTPDTRGYSIIHFLTLTRISEAKLAFSFPPSWFPPLHDLLL
jgi:hypothetical protein